MAARLLSVLALLLPARDRERFMGEVLANMADLRWRSDMPHEERKAWLIAEHPHSGWDTRLDVHRLALTWDQVQQYSPVRDEIDALLDHDRWDAAVERKKARAARLEAVSKRWTEIEDLVG